MIFCGIENFLKQNCQISNAVNTEFHSSNVSKESLTEIPSTKFFFPNIIILTQAEQIIQGSLTNACQKVTQKPTLLNNWTRIGIKSWNHQRNRHYYYSPYHIIINKNVKSQLQSSEGIIYQVLSSKYWVSSVLNSFNVVYLILFKINLGQLMGILGIVKQIKHLNSYYKIETFILIIVLFEFFVSMTMYMDTL